MNRWTEILDCYDPELNPLADLVGDFDARSSADANAWRATQWRQIAGALGWPAAFEHALRTAERAPSGLASLSDAAVEAFTQWLAARQGPTTDLERARVRHQSLAALDALGTEAHALFRVQELSSRLPDSGCYQPKGTPEALPEITTPSPDAPRSPQATFDIRAVQAGTQTSGEAQLRVGSLLGLSPPTDQGARARAFRAEAAPSYFGPGHATRPRGCAYPVQLSLGTYPWVYGNALDREAPGLAWEAGRPWRPAALAMRVMASLWAEPAVNLGQDARLVAAQYRHFRAAVNQLLEGVPVWTDETRGVAGRLYRRAGLLYVHQGSAAVARRTGPRGAVAASAYNYIKRCFAAFFCARRSYVRALDSLPVAARDAYERNPDPCARKLQKAAV